MGSSSQKMACNIRNSTIIFYLLFNFLRELFEDGEFSKTDKKENAFAKHQASSTQDLMLLFNAEKEAVQCLNQTKIELDNKSLQQMIQQYLNLVDYDVETETYEYVYHPINALHLLKRVAKWIPKIKKQ